MPPKGAPLTHLLGRELVSLPVLDGPKVGEGSAFRPDYDASYPCGPADLMGFGVSGVYWSGVGFLACPCKIIVQTTEFLEPRLLPSTGSSLH